MKKKGVTLAVSVVCIGCLFGAYAVLKENNAKQEAEEEAKAKAPILDLDIEHPSSIAFEIGGEMITFLCEGGSWSREDDETFPVSADAVEEVLADLAEVYAVRTLETAEDLSEYGFEEAQNTFVYTDTGGNVTTIIIGANNSSTGDDYLLVEQEGEQLYTISTTLRSSISSDIYDYASGEELPALSEAQIREITVEKEDGNYRLCKENTTWYVETAEGELLEADEDTAESKIASLSYSLTYSDFVEHNCDDASAYGIDDASAVFTIGYQEGTTDSEQTESEEAAGEETEQDAAETELSVLTFYIGEQDTLGNYYVQQEGSKEVHTMSSSVLEDFLEETADGWEAQSEAESETETEALLDK